MTEPSVTREVLGRIAERGLARDGVREAAVPIFASVLADQVTPVMAYRRLVTADERLEPSFLFESVENGDRAGRFTMLGARPTVLITAHHHRVTIERRRSDGSFDTEQREDADPLLAPRQEMEGVALVLPAEDEAPHLPGGLVGGWVGYAGYDTVRYAEPGKLGFERGPRDDRGLADMQMCLYETVVVFDHATGLMHVVTLARVSDVSHADAAWEAAAARLRDTIELIEQPTRRLASGGVLLPESLEMPGSNMTRDEHRAMVERCKEYIRAGDIFQVVVGQRFSERSAADPFDVYRVLRASNPSPYMAYLQARGCVLVASSPEILCRVERMGDALRLTNRPLAGTRRRGATRDEDQSLERELLADEKERAEHVMLVDLGRNDVGRVCKPGTVQLDAVLEVERYSRVMHLSSTVTGELLPGLDGWDALRSTLPVGTVSGAPKIRAMEIIDELEPIKRGPYGGGFGYVGLDGVMDIALALRTMVVLPEGGSGGEGRGRVWRYDIQASGGIVADSDAAAEYDETVNKASALVRALHGAELLGTTEHGLGTTA